MAKSTSRGASKNASGNHQNSPTAGILVTGFVLGVIATLGGQWLLRSGFTGTAQPDDVTLTADVEDNFEFYTLLGNLEVEVPETNLVNAEEDDVIYWLQAGSFRDLSDAENLRVSLLLKNMEAEVKPFSLEGTLWHRVIAGPFQTRTSMNKAKENLLIAGIPSIVLKQDLAE